MRKTQGKWQNRTFFIVSDWVFEHVIFFCVASIFGEYSLQNQIVSSFHLEVLDNDFFLNCAFLAYSLHSLYMCELYITIPIRVEDSDYSHIFTSHSVPAFIQ